MKATTELSNHSFHKSTAPELRFGSRRSSPSLAVYYWDGGTPHPRSVRNISASGVFLLTREPLFPGAVFLLTMQRQDLDESNPDQWIAVHALVVRRDPDGVALSFVFPKDRDTRLRSIDLANGATREEMARFLSKLFAADNRRIRMSVETSDNHPMHPGPTSISTAGDSSPIVERTIAAKACLCNLTRNSLLSPEVRVVNTVKESLKTLIDHLSQVPSSGLWLTPFRGLPLGNGLSRFDVVFLDDNYRIAECAEQFSVAESASFHGKHSSAVVLPSRAISSSRIKVGDQLKICTPDSRASDRVEPLCSIAATTKPGISSERQPACFRDASKPAPSPVPAPAGAAAQTHSSRSSHWINPAKKVRFFRWLFPNVKPPDRRCFPRVAAPAIIAFHNNGGEPRSHKLGDVSSSGFYLLTDERWLPGTRIVMTLQKYGCAEEKSTDWSRVESEVVRWGTNGVGFKFAWEETQILQANESERSAFCRFLAAAMASGPGEPHPAHS